MFLPGISKIIYDFGQIYHTNKQGDFLLNTTNAENRMNEYVVFQTVTSFVMRIRLGGRGYAPAADCVLMKHCKGLSEFTDLMMRLHTIIEDDTSVE